MLDWPSTRRSLSWLTLRNYASEFLISFRLSDMGPHFCVPLRLDCNTDIRTDSVLTICLELGYTRSDVEVMHSFFNLLDMSMTGEIDSTFLSKSLKLQNPDFCSFIMDLFTGCDGHGITFEDFTIACWILFTIEESAMATFTFHLLDMRGSGRIAITEFEAFADAVLDLSNETKYLLKSFFQKLGGDITAQTFSLAAIEYPSLIMPLQLFCKMLRHELVGERRCTELRRRRRELFGNFSLIQIITSMPTKPQSFMRLIDEYGIYGSSGNADRSFNKSTLFNELNDNVDDILVRHPKTYYSAIFHMQPMTAIIHLVDEKRSNASLYTSLYRTCIECSSPNLGKQSRKSTYSRRNQIFPGVIKVSQTHSTDSMTGTKSSELSRSISPREEAMRALQKWSTDISPGINSRGKKQKQTGRSKSSSMESLRLDRNHRINSVPINRGESGSNDLIKEIEASFWVPGAVKYKESSIHPAVTDRVTKSQSERRLV